MTADIPVTSPSRPQTSPSPLSSEWVLGEGFVHEVLRWSIVLAAVAGVVGWLVTAEIAFAVGLWVGAAVDVATFRELARRGAAAMQSGASSVYPVAALLVRLVAKAVLLVIAILLPWNGTFWGVFAGVLVVEFMVLAVGIVRSASAMRRVRGRNGGG
jgi:hypothetical protein